MEMLRIAASPTKAIKYYRNTVACGTYQQSCTFLGRKVLPLTIEVAGMKGKWRVILVVPHQRVNISSRRRQPRLVLASFSLLSQVSDISVKSMCNAHAFLILERIRSLRRRRSCSWYDLE